MAEKYYFEYGGEVEGPVSASILEAVAKAGILPPATPVHVVGGAVIGLFPAGMAVETMHGRLEAAYQQQDHACATGSVTVPPLVRYWRRTFQSFDARVSLLHSSAHWLTSWAF